MVLTSGMLADGPRISYLPLSKMTIAALGRVSKW